MRILTPLFALFIALTMLIACDEREEEPQRTSGIEGLVLVGPQCPAQQASSPCPDLPLQAVIEIFSSNGEDRITSFESGTDGRFAIQLEPGDYLLVPLPPDSNSPFPSAGSQPIIVRRGRWLEVAILYDTGIR